MTTELADATPSNPYSTVSAGTVVGGVLEATLTTSLADSGNPIVSGTTNMHAETYNGMIPGPTFHLTVNDTVIVRLVNNLPYPTGIHWHGIELQNSSDGTPVTQDGILGAPLQTLGNGVAAGGTYLYKFKVTRPGIYWYHPHHHQSTNRVLRGLYGMIVVTDADEQMLVRDAANPLRPLPSADDTLQLVLSDITVCGNVGDNPTYLDPSVEPATEAAEWLSEVNIQAGPSPASLCDTNPLDNAGATGAPQFAAGDIPNIQREVPVGGTPPTVEGQTVLTNGVNVGTRLGTPAAPLATLAAGAYTKEVNRGQGLRLQIVNCATTRYFRLHLANENGEQLHLIRVGGEGGVLDNALLEGGNAIGPEGYDTKYFEGEILIPPASRADIVVVIPSDEVVGSNVTLWTRDYQRTGGVTANWSQLPTVPVMHFNVSNIAAVDPAFPIIGGVAATAADLEVVGTELRSSIAADVDELLPSMPVITLTDPAGFAIGSKPGTAEDILLLAGGGVGISGAGGVRVAGHFGNGDFVPYTAEPHIGSSRYTQQDNILEVTVVNDTGAHHPFHLHGFSFQPKKLEVNGAAGTAIYTWPYQEFRDNLDIPANHTLTFLVDITNNRTLADNVTLGGELGRWLFHCHIFFHAHQGMISELVVTTPDGSEKPNVDVGGSWAYTAAGMPAERNGTFFHHDSKIITDITSTREDESTIGTVTFPAGVSAGNWEWIYPSVVGEEFIEYVYITVTDADGLKDQTVFRLQVGGMDEGSDNGDPHIRTVNGIRYDFQAAGEFILLRDREGMEIQTRQTPVLTANPITDSHSGLNSSVSLNTAVAARVGTHRISYQPCGENGGLQFFLDGKPTRLPTTGIDLDGHRVSAFDADGNNGLRVDYTHQAVLIVTPLFWNSHSLWYMNINVIQTQGDEGLMGTITKPNWLPTLASGANLGPRPKNLEDRYIQLYRTFANSWRVTDTTSLFTYGQGTSSKDFTDLDWPAQNHPSVLKPIFEIPGAPIPANIAIEDAQLICQAITDDDLLPSCVFDVATTGDESFANGYLVTQEIRQKSTSIQLSTAKRSSFVGEEIEVTATVLATKKGSPVATGQVTFFVDNNTTAQAATLDATGKANIKLDSLSIGPHQLRANYAGEVGGNKFHPSASPNLNHNVEKAANGSNKLWIFWLILILIIIFILVNLS